MAKNFFSVNSASFLKIILLILIYGLVFNFVFSTFINFIPFNINYVLAFGLIWHFLQNEIPLTFKKYVGEHK
jgi:F0F1-type ATP synthase assembly protein I